MSQPPLDDRGLPQGYDFDEDMELTPRQVKQMLDGKSDFVFIDCRQQNEWDITHIEGAKLLPLQQLPQRMGELSGLEDKPIVVHCRSGGRSMKFAQFLKTQGYENVKSMAGGILLWNRDVNPGGPQY